MAASLLLIFGSAEAGTPASTEGDLSGGRQSLPRVALRFSHHEPLTIVAFGSSSTVGVGASRPDASYPSQLAVLLSNSSQIRMINRGVSGDDADDMIARIDRDVLAEHPDLVIWQTGSNDPLRHVPLDRFARETRAGIERMRAVHIDVMLMEPQFCPMLEREPSMPGYRAVLRRLAAEFSVPLIRRYDLMRAWLKSGTVRPAELLSPDGLHMADQGYARLAASVAAEIVADARASAGGSAGFQAARGTAH